MSAGSRRNVSCSRTAGVLRDVRLQTGPVGQSFDWWLGVCHAKNDSGVLSLWLVVDFVQRYFDDEVAVGRCEGD